MTAPPPAVPDDPIPPPEVPASGRRKKPASEPRAESTGPHADARRDFCARWKAKYRSETEYGFDYGKHGLMLKWMLEIVGTAEHLSVIFGRYFADDEPFYAAQCKHSLDKLRQNFQRWQVDSAPRSNLSPKAQASHDFALEMMRIAAVGAAQAHAENAAKPLALEGDL